MGQFANPLGGRTAKTNLLIVPIVDAGGTNSVTKYLRSKPYCFFSRSRKVTSFSTIPPPRTGGVGMVYTVYNSSTRLIASKYSFIIRETLHTEILCIYKATRESFRRNCCWLVRLMSFLTHCDTFLNGLHYALPHFDTMLSYLDGIYLLSIATNTSHSEYLLWAQ